MGQVGPLFHIIAALSDEMFVVLERVFKQSLAKFSQVLAVLGLQQSVLADAGQVVFNRTFCKLKILLGSLEVGLGPIALGSLRPGTTRELSVKEIGDLYAAVGL